LKATVANPAPTLAILESNYCGRNPDLITLAILESNCGRNPDLTTLAMLAVLESNCHRNPRQANKNNLFDNV
jgi:hypothetical protein